MKTSPVRDGKFFRVRKVLSDQLAQVAKVCGINQQRIVEDALTLYFNPEDLEGQAQQKVVLSRMRMDGGALPLPRQPAKAMVEQPPSSPAAPRKIHRRSDNLWDNF
jgi:hypothetical protein